jgi:hypothetical protein
MGPHSGSRRTSVERGIYLQSNGKYAVCCRHAGRLRFRTVDGDLAAARRARTALIAATRARVEPVSPQLRFDTVATWWLERFEAKVAAGERRPRTLDAHRYQLEHSLLPALAARRINMITVDDVASCFFNCNADADADGRRRQRAHWRRYTACCATPAGRAGRPSTLSPNSSATSAHAPRVGASACSDRGRSSVCSMPARRGID